MSKQNQLIGLQGLQASNLSVRGYELMGNPTLCGE